jgi:hypothetical protein
MPPSVVRIVKIVKSKRLQWIGHVARLERHRMHTEFWWRNLLVNICWEDRRRWENNIEIHLREMSCRNGRWMELA